MPIFRRRRPPRRPPPRRPPPVPPPPPPPPIVIAYTVNALMPRVVLVDFGGNGISQQDLARAALALTKQACEHLAQPPPVGYGIGAVVRPASGPGDVQPGEWVLGLFASPDIPGAYGYHDETPAGQPLMKVFPLLDAADGVPWTVTASHELLETLVDPNLDRAAQAPNGTFWCLEVCDAVEARSYLIDGVAVSDWVTPAYFEPPPSIAGLKLDYMGLVSQPHQLLPGGYNQYWDEATGWKPVFAEQKPRAYRMAAMETGRGARRRGRY